MRARSLLEVIDAAHLSYYVESPFPSRGGLMIVGPPGVLKSTFIATGLCEYPSALVLSDLNVQQLVRLRDDLSSARYTSIGFTEFEKLYQRAAATSDNIEGHIKALVEEGFTRASFEDQGMATMHARALVIGAMTYAFYSRKFADWADKGFARRFLWSVIRLRDPEVIINAIHKWEKHPIGDIRRKMVPASHTIPYNLTKEESGKIYSFLRDQPNDALAYLLLKKIYVALKWKTNGERKKGDTAMAILEDFAESLRKNGAYIDL